MRTLTIRTTIGANRQLTIPLPKDVRPRLAEVVVHVTDLPQRIVAMITSNLERTGS